MSFIKLIITILFTFLITTNGIAQERSDVDDQGVLVCAFALSYTIGDFSLFFDWIEVNGELEEGSITPKEKLVLLQMMAFSHLKFMAESTADALHEISESMNSDLDGRCVEI